MVGHRGGMGVGGIVGSRRTAGSVSVIGVPPMGWKPGGGGVFVLSCRDVPTPSVILLRFFFLPWPTPVRSTRKDRQRGRGVAREVPLLLVGGASRTKGFHMLEALGLDGQPHFQQRMHHTVGDVLKRG